MFSPCLAFNGTMNKCGPLKGDQGKLSPNFLSYSLGSPVQRRHRSGGVKPALPIFLGDDLAFFISPHMVKSPYPIRGKGKDAPAPLTNPGKPALNPPVFLVYGKYKSSRGSPLRDLERLRPNCHKKPTNLPFLGRPTKGVLFSY